MSEPIYNSAGEVLYPGLAGDGAGYRGSRLVTLTPEGWEKAEGTWPLMQAAPVPEAKIGYVALGSYPDSYGAERVALYDVSFDDLTLADWEAAKLGQIEAPFTFEDFDVLDS